MTFWKWAIALPAVALLAACSPLSIHYDYDPHASFAGYHSYDWYAAGPKDKDQAEGVANPIMDRRVHRIVEQELAARGFKRETTGRPDFLLTYYPVYRTRVVETYTAMGPAWGYGWGPRPWGYGAGAGFRDVQSFREGSIVLEVMDARSQMVWQAAAEGALTGIRDPQDADEQVTEAVKRMFAKFPPPPSQGR